MYKQRKRIRHTTERGATMPLVAVGMIGMLAMTGLALDFSHYFYQRRIMQAAADAGAVAGAYDVFRGKKTYLTNSARAATANNQFAHNVKGINVTVNNPPQGGHFKDKDLFVEVTITQDIPAYFLPVLGINTKQVSARSVAGVRGNPGGPCVYVLDPSGEKAFTVTSTSTFSTSCGIQVNSTAYNAYNIESGSKVIGTGDPLPTYNVKGGSNITSGSSSNPMPNTGKPALSDPLAYLSEPSVGACTYASRLQVSTNQTLNPGVYCGGLELSSVTVNLNPGLYIFKNGGFKAGSGAIVNGTGVMFFNTSTGDGGEFRPITFESGSKAHLTAPPTGSYAGILFFEGRSAGKSGDLWYNHVASTGSGKFEGAMYFPRHFLTLAVSSSSTTLKGLIVAQRVEVASNSNANMDGLTNPVVTKAVAMVE